MTKRKTIIGVIAGVCALLAVFVAAGEGMPFSGSDAAVQSGARGGTSVALHADAQQDGITVSVVNVLADTTQTVFEVTIDGRNDVGEFASASNQPSLVDPFGVIYRASQVLPTGADPRRQTWYFPAVTSADGLWSIEFDGILVRQKPGESATALDSLRSLELPRKWRIQFEWSAKPVQATVRPVAASPSQFGPGEIIVDTVTFGPTGILVSGHLVGIPLDEIPELEMFPPQLALSDGTVLQPTGGRSGYGPDRSSWEFRFPDAPSTPVRLHVPLNVANPAHDEQAAAALRSSGGDADVEIAFAN